MILYFCPDMAVQSGGIRRLYRHVHVLTSRGFDAAILHLNSGFVMPDVHRVPVRYLDRGDAVRAGDLVVIPEGFPQLMKLLQDEPVRRFVIALSWSYIYPALDDRTDWRSYGIERVLAVSPFVRDFVSWSMGLPVDLLDFSVDPARFRYDPAAKRPEVSYFARKAESVQVLRRVLRSRNPAFLDALTWRELHELTESDYATELRRSSVYLALGTAEGLNLSVWEAMASGAIVAGYDGLGLRDALVGDGPEQNAVVAPNGDYVTLARLLEPLLDDVLSDRMRGWQPLIDRARALTAAHTPESEAHSIVEFWRGILG